MRIIATSPAATSAAHMPSPAASERTRTFRFLSSLSRKENWSTGLPDTPMALGHINMGRRNNALKFIRRRALSPFAYGRKLRERILCVRVQIQRRVEDQLAANQAAGIVARRVIVV